jgi:hypothetical protein
VRRGTERHWAIIYSSFLFLLKLTDFMPRGVFPGGG